MSFDPRDPPDPYENPDPARSARESPIDPYDYRDPFDPVGGLTDAGRQSARWRVLGPAVIHILVGLLNLLAGALTIPPAIAIYNMPPEAFEAQTRQDQGQELDNLKKQGITPQGFQTIAVVVYGGIGAVSILFGILILAGGVCMIALKMWGLGVTASVLAVISPGGCCVFGTAGGIWGLIALMNPNVRSAFR